MDGDLPLLKARLCSRLSADVEAYAKQVEGVVDALRQDNHRLQQELCRVVRDSALNDASPGGPRQGTKERVLSRAASLSTVRSRPLDGNGQKLVPEKDPFKFRVDPAKYESGALSKSGSFAEMPGKECTAAEACRLAVEAHLVSQQVAKDALPRSTTGTVSSVTEPTTSIGSIEPTPAAIASRHTIDGKLSSETTDADLAPQTLLQEAEMEVRGRARSKSTPAKSPSSCPALLQAAEAARLKTGYRSDESESECDMGDGTSVVGEGASVPDLDSFRRSLIEKGFGREGSEKRMSNECLCFPGSLGDSRASSKHKPTQSVTRTMSRKMSSCSTHSLHIGSDGRRLGRHVTEPPADNTIAGMKGRRRSLGNDVPGLAVSNSRNPSKPPMKRPSTLLGTMGMLEVPRAVGEHDDQDDSTSVGSPRKMGRNMSRRPSTNSLFSAQMTPGGPDHVVFTLEEAKTGLELLPCWKQMAEAIHVRKLAMGFNGFTSSTAPQRGFSSGPSSSVYERSAAYLPVPLRTSKCSRGSRGSSRSSPRNLRRSLSNCSTIGGYGIMQSFYSRREIIIHPNSHFKMVWDIFGMILMGYDLIVIPIQTFNPPPNFFTNIMAWTTLLFWTADMPICFFTGFQKNGAVEMSPRMIWKRYLATWFVFDVAVLAIDWTLTIFDEVAKQADANGGSGSDLGYVKMGRSARIVRMLRLLRLLRLLKVQGKISEVLEAIQSEYVRIILGIVKLIVCIMLVNHLIACGWYSIGNLPSRDTWVQHYRLDDRDIGYRYTTSLHWSLTQFTPASMEVNGRNTIERIYTVTVLLFAMVTFSSFISSITNATTLLRQLDSSATDRRNALFKYLKEHDIPMALASEVWGWVLSTKDTSKHRIHEKDVLVLSLLPKSLRTQLRDQVYGPFVTLHPFFKRLSDENPQGQSKLYANAMGEVAVGIGQELFMADEIADRMYFLVGGVMHYLEEKSNKKSTSELDTTIQEGTSLPTTAHSSFISEKDVDVVAQVTSNTAPSSSGFFDIRKNVSKGKSSDTVSTARKSEHKKKTIVKVGSWFCEPVLWVKWKHKGQLNAHDHSELYGLTVDQFTGLVKSSPTDFQEACRYASSFLRHIACEDVVLTDVWADVDLLTQITTEAFDDFLFQQAEDIGSPYETGGSSSFAGAQGSASFASGQGPSSAPRSLGQVVPCG